MIVIAATIYVQEGKGEEFIKEYREAAPKVLKDPGAITYTLHRDLKDPNKFFFYEMYQDQKAVEYHTSTPHFKAFFGAVGPIMKGKPEIGHYQPLGL